MNLPPLDPAANADLTPDARKPWPTWLKIVVPIAVVGAAAAIIVVALSNGSDNGGTTTGTTGTTGTARTVAQTTSVNGSSTTSTATTAGASTTASGSQPATSTSSTVTPTTIPSSTQSATTATPTPSTQIDLGAAAAFGVLGNSGVTSSGPTTSNGQVGASNGSVDGFSATKNPDVVVVDSPTAANGQLSAQGVAAQLDALTSTTLESSVLANQTIGPGIYSTPALGVAGTVTLDGAGDPNAMFVFESQSDMNISAGAQVVLVGGAQACNVFWRLGGSAAFGSGSSFVGTVIAEDTIAAATGAEFSGRLIARNGAVFLNASTIDIGTCS